MADPKPWLPTNQPTDYTVISDEVSLNGLVDRITATAAETRQDIKVKPPEGVPAPTPDQRIKKSDTIRVTQKKGDARVQYCFCYEGRAISVTVRGKKADDVRVLDAAPDPVPLVTGYQGDPRCDRKFLVSVDQISHCVYNLLEWNGPRNGFLIVSGGTNSLKTELVLSLIERRLSDLMADWIKGERAGRKPHLVTCEDTIEKLFLDRWHLKALKDVSAPSPPDDEFDDSLWRSNPDYPDYTPRLRGKDTVNLEDAVEAALRMTPAVFYAGEIRKPRDWKPLYRLAQSHIVALTTHASSLVNTFAVLQRYLDVKTAAQRSELAGSIHSVIHMQPGSLPLKGTNQEVQWVLPALWTRTDLSVPAYTADGASSLAPEFVPIPERGDSYCVGRQAFARAWQKYASNPAGFYNPPGKRWAIPDAPPGTPRELPRPMDFVFQPLEILLPEIFEPKAHREFFDKLIEQAIVYDLQGE